VILTNIQSIAEQVHSIEAGSDENWKEVSHRTIFHEILNSKLPPTEKSTKRLCDDGIVMVIAGSLTTSWALSVATYYLLTQPATLRILKGELLQAMPEQTQRVSLPILENLPYLTACVQECLRLSYGVSTRLQRICPDEVLTFNDGKKNWQIPAGTPTSMTSVLVHHDPTIFPNSHSFVPERWIETPHLDRYLVSFSKGSRQCIGINLAYAELYLALARIFRTYGSKDVRMEGDLGYLELFETGLRDVEIEADRFIPLPAVDSKGIRVHVRDI
jgi:cytochrome P450